MSNVQFNLLPDVKINLQKTERLRKLVLSISILVTASALSIFLFMLFTVDVIQAKSMRDAAKDIDSASNQLKNIPSLDDIITVQNQLKSLSSLHQGKHISSRIFTYLPQVTPSNVSVSQLNLDLKQNTLVITGTAGSQKIVNAFIDSLKNATYTVGDQGSPTIAFPSVIESSFGINAGSVGYTITISFDPKLFVNNLLDSQGKHQTPKLSVPNQITTPSALPNTNGLFNGQNTGGSNP